MSFDFYWHKNSLQISLVHKQPEEKKMKSVYSKIAVVMALSCQLANATPLQAETEVPKKTLLCEEVTVFKKSVQMVDFDLKVFEVKLTTDEDTNVLYGEYENLVGDILTTITLEEDENLKGLFQAKYVHGPKGFGRVSSFATLLKKSITINSNDELEDMWTTLTLGDSKTATAYTLTTPGTLSPDSMVVLEKAYADVLLAFNKKHGTNILVKNSMSLTDSISGLQIEGAAKEILSQFKDGETLVRGMNAICIERH